MTNPQDQGELIELQSEDGYPSGFTMVDNLDIWDVCTSERRLLLRPSALGVYVAMRSLPPCWRFWEGWLMDHLGLGREALRTAVRELVAAGRLDKVVIRDPKGRYTHTIWRLRRAGAGPSTGFPSAGSPPTADPASGEVRRRDARQRITHRLSNTESSNTDRSTTTAADDAGEDLVWPTDLTIEQVVVVREWLQGLDRRLQQALLDEYQGATAVKTLETPMGWLKSTIARAKQGGFVPDLGVSVAKRRAKCAEEAAGREAARAAAAERQRRLEDPYARERAARAIEEGNALFGIRKKAS